MRDSFVIKMIDLLGWKSVLRFSSCVVYKAAVSVVSVSKLTVFSSLFSTSLPCVSEDVWRHEECNLCNISPQQCSPLELAHLHLSLQCGRTLHRLNQQKLHTLSVQALEGKTPWPKISQQSKAQGVSQHTGGWNPEQNTWSTHIRHHWHEVKVDGDRSLVTSFVLLDTGITLASPVT